VYQIHSLKAIVLLLQAFVLFSYSGYGQSTKDIDSLELLLQRSTGSNKIDLLYSLAYEFIDVNNPVALEYAELGLKLATDRGDSLRMVRTGRLEASALRRLEKIDSSILVSEQILAIARRNHFVDEIKMLLNPLAVAYTYNAEYDKALDLHFESLIARERDQDKFRSALR
jgi:hypothetical protein